MSKNIIKVLSIGLIALGMSSNISAQTRSLDDGSGTFFGKEATGKWIIGLKAGRIDNNVEDIKDADALGIVLGYEFDRPIGGNGTSTVELEYLSGDETGLFGIGEYEADMLNMFFTYRSPGSLYFKFKVGLSYSDIQVDFPGERFDNEDVGLAAGLGLGYHVGDYGVIELEYTEDSGDNDLGYYGINALLEF